ncbi:MAG: TonB-dependent receptor [Campylobacterota bacterium]|nr:TonB-dependent receptor [Campylobacterota bacterium]
MNINTILSIALVVGSVQSNDDLFDESLENIFNIESELKADIGSRSGSRNFLDSRSPLDVITYEQIDNSGLTSLNDVLRYFVAGFNSPETSVADGSDHIRAFSLRGMNPDQILVLVNGKRVHTSALLHVNGTIGRGSSSVDLDTIALRSIQKIEILRDGAAAQYGSDAISGVINIILKGLNHTNSVNIHGGSRIDGDGEQINADTFITIPLKYDGFINVTMQAKQQNSTSRGGIDPRVEIPRVTTHVGIPDSKNLLAVLNSEIPQANNLNFYLNSIVNYRESEASAFFRPKNHNDATTVIYPNGFLPMIDAKIVDYSATFGVEDELDNNIYWDLSNVYGVNKINYYLSDTMNYSLGSASPTSFSNGSLTFIQNTTNLDLKKKFDKLELAGGAEFRYESYEIKAGEESSYIDGGSQGFSGYAPLNAVDENRNSYALYLDATYNFNDDFALEGASRYENFSDFGATTNFKLALSFKALDDILLRSSASTGFRAPSLTQSNYSHTSTFGGLIEGTFKPTHEVSKLFGANDLEPEKSTHFTVGSVYQPIKNISFMIDYFYTHVDDRIMLSNEFTLSDAQQTEYGINKARFFTNAVNTKTQGIDIRLNYKQIFEDSSSLNSGVWYNYSVNSVIGFNDSSITRENSFEQVDRIENAQPKSGLKFLTSYKKDKFDTTLNISRYGSYNQVVNNRSYKFTSEWGTDLDISYKVTKKTKIAIGGNNIFDSIPNRWEGLSGTFYGYDGIKPYSRYSPIGYSGAYYYLRLSMEF